MDSETRRSGKGLFFVLAYWLEGCKHSVCMEAFVLH